MAEFKTIKVLTEGVPPKTLSEFEVSYMTPLQAFTILYNWDVKSLSPKVRYWYKLYETDYRGELFLRDIIKVTDTHKPENFSEERSKLIISICYNRIRKEKYWLLKAENQWKVASLLIGYGLGLLSGYGLYVLTH